MKKIISACIIISILFMIFCNFVQAGDVIPLFKGEDPGTEGVDEIKTIIDTAITIVQSLGIFIAIAMLIILGIKYMMASPGEKAEIKKHLTVYVVGAVLLFGVSGILEIVEKVVLDVTA